ncbi:MAG: hypothetical protein ACPGGH_08335, partial [Chitinophagales bacterium]
FRCLAMHQGRHKYVHNISKEESNLVLSYGMALMINISIWGALRRSIRIFMAGLIGITLLLWL